MIKKILVFILTISAMCFAVACADCGVTDSSNSTGSSTSSSADAGTSDSDSSVEDTSSDFSYEGGNNELPPVEIPDQN